MAKFELGISSPLTQSEEDEAVVSWNAHSPCTTNERGSLLLLNLYVYEAKDLSIRPLFQDTYDHLGMHLRCYLFQCSNQTVLSKIVESESSIQGELESPAWRLDGEQLQFPLDDILSKSKPQEYAMDLRLVVEIVCGIFVVSSTSLSLLSCLEKAGVDIEKLHEQPHEFGSPVGKQWTNLGGGESGSLYVAFTTTANDTLHQDDTASSLSMGESEDMDDDEFERKFLWQEEITDSVYEDPRINDSDGEGESSIPNIQGKRQRDMMDTDVWDFYCNGLARKSTLDGSSSHKDAVYVTPSKSPCDNSFPSSDNRVSSIAGSEVFAFNERIQDLENALMDIKVEDSKSPTTETDVGCQTFPQYMYSNTAREGSGIMLFDPSMLATRSGGMATVEAMSKAVSYYPPKTPSQEKKKDGRRRSLPINALYGNRNLVPKSKARPNVNGGYKKTQMPSPYTTAAATVGTPNVGKLHVLLEDPIPTASETQTEEGRQRSVSMHSNSDLHRTTRSTSSSSSSVRSSNSSTTDVKTHAFGRERCSSNTSSVNSKDSYRYGKDQKSRQKEKRKHVDNKWNQVVIRGTLFTVGKLLTIGNVPGVVRYIGPTHLGGGKWLGVELCRPKEGGHTGSIDGYKYFECAPGRGVFVRASELEGK